MPEMEFEKPRFAYIEWIDACGDGGWRRPPFRKGVDLRVKSMGFLVEEDEDAVVIAGSISGVGSADNPMTIPRSAITLYEEVTFDG